MHNLSRTTGTCVVAGAFMYAVVFLALHVLRPEYNPASRFMSEYAVGPYGFLGVAAFLLMSGAMLSLALGLYMAVHRSVPLYVVCALLVIVAAAFCIGAAFPTDLQPLSGGRPASTLSGAIHNTSALIVFLALIPAALTLPSAYRRDTQWKSLSRAALVLALCMFVLLIAFAISPWSYKGLAQRAEILAIVVWLLVNGFRIRTLGAANATA